MDPRAKTRLQKALDDTTANWVEVSADDVIEAFDALDPDKVTANLAAAGQAVIRGRPPARRGPPAYRGMNVRRQDLEHLLGRLEELKPEPEGSAGTRAEAQAVPDAPEAEAEGEEADRG